MQVLFDRPYGSADLHLVLALWHELVSEWHPTEDPMHATIPRGAALETLARYLRSDAEPEARRAAAHKACRFDVMLRLASGRVNTMHATDAFFTHGENASWFVPSKASARDSARIVQCVRLTEAAIAAWEASAPIRAAAIASARALLESDIDTEGDSIGMMPEQDVPAGRVAIHPSLLPAGADRKTHLEALVRRIQEEVYQPVYRRKPFGAPVTGWDARLRAYFWPTPDQGYAQTCAALEGIVSQARTLAKALSSNGNGWSAPEQAAAVALAHAIFKWGGVPQDPATVTPHSVEQVFRAAMANDGKATANMNSGWTKLAAFASDHYEEDGVRYPQVIWDSRVAAALVSRLDVQLSEGESPSGLFPGVGTVPGRGGTRPRALLRRWPSAYRSWAGQVAGSALVREVRDILNGGGYPGMPLPEGGAGPWTTRGVEMVLFMDGY